MSGKTIPEISDTLEFIKMQGVGNDFVLVDARQRQDLNWSGLAPEICNRRFGVGADGLLVISPSRVADLTMRMYNPDGTPDFCGNGLRCVARYAVERHLVDKDSLTISTLAGTRSACVSRDDSGVIRSVTVDMGAPRFDPQDVPIKHDGERAVNIPLKVGDREITVTALSTGSTHTVIFLDELPTEPEFQEISPAIENHPAFPERTSVMWCRVESDHRIQMRIWERGAGETWGCGTGSCAAAVAGILLQRTGNEVAIVSRGGELIVRWRPGETIELEGAAETVFQGLYPL